MEVYPSVAVGSIEGFEVDAMLPLPLTRISSWCATKFALIKHGVGSFDNFLIVFHALPLLCVILVDVMTSSQQQWGSDFFGHAGHADPLDGWRCCSQKWVMSRPIQVRQL